MGPARFGARIAIVAVTTLAVVALAGCAADQQGGDPGAAVLPSGQSCKSIRSELNRLDSKGVPSRIEAANNGSKLSPAQRAEVDQYNSLLNQYLGARCHV